MSKRASAPYFLLDRLSQYPQANEGGYWDNLSSVFAVWPGFYDLQEKNRREFSKNSYAGDAWPLLSDAVKTAPFRPRQWQPYTTKYP